jgi:hypothetical protein
MAPTEPRFDADAHAERLEAYVRPYVIALLRIVIASYEREKRDQRLAEAFSMDGQPSYWDVMRARSSDAA